MIIFSAESTKQRKSSLFLTGTEVSLGFEKAHPPETGNQTANYHQRILSKGIQGLGEVGCNILPHLFCRQLAGRWAGKGRKVGHLSTGLTLSLITAAKGEMGISVTETLKKQKDITPS